ncbi:nuclear transport factor 2 family protein [Paraburkholderia sp. JHI869]|uniref:nuclear transport factor 2 family protein n=1 Tax=Paraburkholderia sp. JHI869 TaxID=3112959 RepID=UPI003170F7F6
MSDSNEIIELVQRYFDATWRGDAEQLRTVFDPRAVVAGEVDGQPYYKTIDEYLAGVAKRKSPAELGEPVDTELLMLDVLENIATAKLHVRMLGFNYYNYFSIMRQHDKWLVITKTLTNVQ